MRPEEKWRVVFYPQTKAAPDCNNSSSTCPHIRIQMPRRKSLRSPIAEVIFILIKAPVEKNAGFHISSEILLTLDLLLQFRFAWARRCALTGCRCPTWLDMAPLSFWTAISPSTKPTRSSSSNGSRIRLWFISGFLVSYTFFSWNVLNYSYSLCCKHYRIFMFYCRQDQWENYKM